MAGNRRGLTPNRAVPEAIGGLTPSPGGSRTGLEPAWDVIVVGAGAAGLMAAAAAAGRGRRTLVLEKNNKIGVKILMSGGTRCNITHDCGPREIAARFGHARKFLEHPVGRLPPRQIVELMESLGVATKVESTGKVFPVSDSAVDVRDALVRRAVDAGAAFRAGAAVRQVDKASEHFRVLADAGELTCTSLILTSGGQSYPGCGTTGDGYAWAAAFGHELVPRRPALTPLVSEAAWVRELAGVTVEDCRAVARTDEGQGVGEADQTSLLFTHTGLSGPLPMNLSRWFTESGPDRARELDVDFSPAINREQWLERLKKLVAVHPKSTLGNLACDPLPRRLLESLLALGQIDPGLKLGEAGNKPLQTLASLIKSCRIPIHDTRGFAKAEVTAGGVALEGVDNRTMQSRHQAGLFLAGEILDLDGPIGGFNFQAAFSTGHLAGLNA